MITIFDRIVTSRTSKTNVKGGKKTTTVQEVKKTTQQGGFIIYTQLIARLIYCDILICSSFAGRPLCYVFKVSTPYKGRWDKIRPNVNMPVFIILFVGRYDQFSSPTGIRSRMDENMPKAIKTAIMPPEYKGVQDIRKLKAFAPFKDTVSCAMNISRPKSSGPPGYYADSYDSSFLESHVCKLIIKIFLNTTKQIQLLE